MKARPFLLLAVLSLGLTRPLLADDAPAKSLFDPARHMHVDEVKAGMKGYGLSVFSGTKVEKFGVEVISVLRNQMGPQKNVVLIRATGQGLEHSGSVAGMSGSPIFLVDGNGKERMIGAFALGWNYCKDPIAGVRPIEEMLEVQTHRRDPEIVASAETSSNRTWSLLSVKSLRAVSSEKLSTPPVDPRAMRPLATPVMISGANAKLIEQLRPTFAEWNMVPLQAGGAGSPPEGTKPTAFEPGGVIAVPIVSGDLDMSAVGTVTEVLGQRVYAFGHEFNGEGAIDLPIATGYIHTIIPSLESSFKMGSSFAPTGALYSDETVAVAGEIGHSPEMIPVEVSVATPGHPEPRVFHYKLARHPSFTPRMALTTFVASATGFSGLPEESSIDYDVTLEFENGRKIHTANIASTITGVMSVTQSIAFPIEAASSNPFKRVALSKMSATLKVKPQVKALNLIGATSAKTSYKPGDTAKIVLRTHAYRGEDATQTIDLPLPKDLPDGQYSVVLSDRSTRLAQIVMEEGFRFQTRNIDEVFDNLPRLLDGRDDAIYVRMPIPSAQGAGVGRAGLSKLPPTRLNLLTKTARPDIAPFVDSIGKVIPSDHIIAGSATVEITVARNPNAARQPTLHLPTPQPQPGAAPAAAPAAAQHAPD